jgi:50S ribosomal subunit-associated GTPase HflX
VGQATLKKVRFADVVVLLLDASDSHGLVTIQVSREREFFIDNLPVRIHLIIEIISVDRPCAMGV